ncbi:hypothetical protein [Rhodopseudomonas sp. WA056]|uniref:hypothetical protein n=1 Tax=Rhodopseudomonas sp. WA056 TaxID=2269367 RepID=UPI0013DF1C6F|nr:hypothetical protein [Rhodopseudomonas sp. WA056]
MANDRNSLPELIEVITRISNSNEPENREIRVELRVNSVTLVADDSLEFVVQLERANLAIDLDGFEVVPKSRHGEPTKPNDVSVEREMRNEKTQKGEISGNAELTLAQNPSGSLGLKAAGSVASTHTESHNSKETYSFLRVKARGNLTWEVSEPGDTRKVLDDTYLNDDVLCKIKALPGANMLAVRLDAFARKRDIRITPLSKLSKFTFKSTNHEKMFNALVAKSLAQSKANGGILTFSVSEITVEDDKPHR